MSNQQQPPKPSAPAPELWSYDRCMGREIEAVEFIEPVIAPGIADRTHALNLRRPDHKNIEIACGVNGVCARLVKRVVEPVEVDGKTYEQTTLIDSARGIAWANVKAVMFKDVVSVSRVEVPAVKKDAA